jgi:hypothetical protein
MIVGQATWEAIGRVMFKKYTKEQTLFVMHLLPEIMKDAGVWELEVVTHAEGDANGSAQPPDEAIR